MIHAIMPEKNTRIFIIFFRKINKIPEFYTIFARKMPEFYIIIAQKYFSRILGGHVPLCPPPSPTPMTDMKITNSSTTEQISLC